MRLAHLLLTILVSCVWATCARPDDLEEKETPVRICRWYGGKKAALILRLDDSHPTHIERAIPMLNEFGLVGSFLVNPGHARYQQYRDAWEGPVIQQGHELGDHTLHHRGARTDREAEAEIGEPAELLHRLQPESRLTVFLGGGKTLWLQRKPIDFFIAKYALHPRGRRGGHRMRIGCTEVYPSFSVNAFRQRLDEAIAQGASLEASFHQIGEGSLYCSPPVFRQLLEATAAREDDIWQAGKGRITEYDVTRDAATLWVHPEGDDALVVHFACAADPDLYRRPLTLEFDLPEAAKNASVVDEKGKLIEVCLQETDGGRVGRFDVAPVDAVFAVKAAGIGAECAKNTPTDIPLPGPHPYLFFTGADVSALREKATDSHAAGMWKRIQQTADEFVGEDLDRAVSERDRWGARRRITVLSFTYALTGNKAYAGRAIPEIESVLVDDSWHVSNADTHVAAQAIGTLALAYDWMYDAIPEDIRGRMRNTIVEQGIEPILAAAENEEWWTSWYRCNWGAVIYGQAGVAALSLLPDDSRAADWVRFFRQRIWHYTQSLGDDGGWGESATYASFAWSNALPFMDALRNLTDGGQNLFESPKLQHLPDWFINMSEPDGAGFVPFSNCNLGVRSVPRILYRLAAEYRDGHAQRAAREMTLSSSRPDVFEYLWYDPTLEPGPLKDLPLAKRFRSIDWAMLRSDWDDPEGILFALKGGQKDWDHHHHDANHFVLYAYGRPLIVDLHYPYDIWGCQTEAHNTIMVNEKDQRGKVKVEGGRGRPDHRGIVSDLVAAPWYARLVGDASLAYDQDDVNSFMREIIYLRRTEATDPADYFVIFDDVDLTRPSQVDWMLHTYGEIGLDGNRITITQDDAAADLTMVSPEPFVCDLRQKSLEEVRAPSPFEGAESLKYIKLRPAEPLDHAFFLSVLAPRPTSEHSSHAVTGLREPNLLGARVVTGVVDDVALFALDEPEIAAAGVTALGRTCFLRRAGGKVQRVALHNGQRISADGTLLFETDSCGNAVVAFSDDVIDATVSLYNSDLVRIHAPSRPAKVLVNGEDRSFEYEDNTKCVRLDYDDIRQVRVCLTDTE